MAVTSGHRTSDHGDLSKERDEAPGLDGGVALDARAVSHAFGRTRALDNVSLSVKKGEIHALLGPNGAGKTTLVRALVGLLDPDDGEITILGKHRGKIPRRYLSKLIGLADSADRNFYLRISGLENLVFYARLHGFRRRDAISRAREALDAVGLGDVGRKRVRAYSHGMLKRLGVARAILHDPPVLLIDEATHDLDPIATRMVHDLMSSKADRGVAILWATQRVDEIRGFANRVTLLNRAEVRFSGTVPELMALSAATRYLLRLTVDDHSDLGHRPEAAVDGLGTITRTSAEQGDHYVLALSNKVILGDALHRLLDAGINVVSCTHERSGIEEAFLRLTRPQP